MTQKRVRTMMIVAIAAAVAIGGACKQVGRDLPDGGDASTTEPAAAAAPTAATAAPNACAEKLRVMIAMQTGKEVEVSATTQLTGFRQVILRIAGQDGLSEYWVTDDCAYMTDKLVKFDEYAAKVEEDKALADCLFQAGVAVFGTAEDRRTQTQLGEVGRFGARLFIDCSGEMVDKCRQAGVTRLPSIGYQRQFYPGPMARSTLRRLTGCGAEKAPEGEIQPLPPARPPQPPAPPPVPPVEPGAAPLAPPAPQPGMTLPPPPAPRRAPPAPAEGAGVQPPTSASPPVF